MTLGVLGYSTKALWYLTRGFGLVALLTLTISLVLGLTQAARYARPGWPRFLISGLHRNASLLAVVVLAVHVVTAVTDSYAPINLIDAFVPFVSRYRPVWTGLGALALDLLIALVLTSLMRERLGYRAWRSVHWAAYACWPIAVVHGLGTGTDSRLGWVQFVYAVCAALVLGALWWRLAKGVTVETRSVRMAAVLASVALPLTVVVWATAGPLKPGWARRAGTPAALLGASPVATASSPMTVPFSAEFSGVQSAAEAGRGLVSITIQGSFRGGQTGILTVVLTGQPIGGGGVELTASQVSLGSVSYPRLLQGHVTSLAGTSLSVALADAAGKLFRADIRLQVEPSNDRVTGALSVSA